MHLPTPVSPRSRLLVIRRKDIFTVPGRAIEATETAAHILDGIVIKNA